jgi:hypothetical protein
MLPYWVLPQGIFLESAVFTNLGYQPTEFNASIAEFSLSRPSVFVSERNYLELFAREMNPTQALLATP